MSFASITRAAAICCTLFASIQVSADEPGHHPGPGEGRPRKPPPEAYSACADQSQGDECTVSFGEHSITGNCTPDREDGKLFCRPSRPPGPPR
jgi:hypothetical protein